MLARYSISPILLVVLVIASCGGRRADPSSPLSPAPVAAAIPWADEFEGPAGSKPDPAKWTYDLGNNNGWGNNELQAYTDAARNAARDGLGHLIIQVESTSDGFTSARLKTKGLLAAQYGRLEARIQVPVGQGLWPAFWMLGATFNGSNWPQCGEIDIMEHVGREPFTVYGSVHGPGYSGGRAITAAQTLPAGQRVADDYHTFAVQWEPQRIAFYLDDVQYQVVTPAVLPAGAGWVFDQPFFVLLNVAVGGTFPGPPDATTRFPQAMLVDYIRYTPLPASRPSP